ncbi:MurR/RpiR family transcriptional regulator [Breznakiella homolactica]|uniref:MurR/RpiR family transcriptional regulator n=1 Tax=Breznakiella homolactica TaxID=2798577 RepID=A0A7T7XMC5_9SPIR|nr:MurR/RpiR family transcriptional regulator [Breznakiella homolactica]QQO08980.1 MurR/RpiR family transcriptional regulator [Breznakiella homolactica]
MESALFAIRQHMPDLPAAERKVAEYVLAEPRKVLYFNITELARQSGVSQAAIVRFSRRIGMTGFSDFKLCLSHDVFRNSDERFLPDLDLETDMEPAEVVKGVIGGIQRSLARLESVTDINRINATVESILGARMIHSFGVGASGLVAQDLFQKLIRIGLPCSQTSETDLQITAACNLRSDDLAFIISYSGENSAMLTVAEWARKNKSTIITLTMDTENSLRTFADIALVVPALERVYRTGATLSRINQLTVVDIIFSMLISKDLDTTITSLEQTMAATHYGKDPEP